MLGHTNLSQTSTYLHAAEMGLQESMCRFDVARGNPVANQAAMEHPPLGRTEPEQADKGRLH